MQLTIEKQIKNFVVENFLFGESNNGLNDDDSLLEKGIMDSTGVLELVAFIEENYRIKVKDEELIPENLDSIAYISDFIRRKQLMPQSS
jgi:acyl carrier protein